MPEIQRSDILRILRKQPCITPMELTTMHQTTNTTNIGATTLLWDKSTITYPFLDFKEKSLNNNPFSSKTKYSAGFHYRQEQISAWLNEKLHKLSLHLHLLLLGRENKTPTRTSPLQFWCSSPAARHSPAQRGAAKAEAQGEAGDGCHTLRPPSPAAPPQGWTCPPQQRAPMGWAPDAHPTSSSSYGEAFGEKRPSAAPLTEGCDCRQLVRGEAGAVLVWINRTSVFLMFPDVFRVLCCSKQVCSVPAAQGAFLLMQCRKE